MLMLKEDTPDLLNLATATIDIHIGGFFLLQKAVRSNAKLDNVSIQ